MSVSGLAGSLYTLQRTSPYVLDPVAASAGGHSASRQPPVASVIQVKAPAAGTVAVAGTVDGSSTSETLTFTGAGFRATVKRFAALTTLTPAGALLGGSIEAKALGADGTPHNKLKSDVVNNLPGVFTPGIPRWAANQAAKSPNANSEQAMLGFDWVDSFAINRGDHLLDEGTGDRWLVLGTNLLRGRVIPHHWEVWVAKWDGEAPL